MLTPAQLLWNPNSIPATLPEFRLQPIPELPEELDAKGIARSVQILGLADAEAYRTYKRKAYEVRKARHDNALAITTTLAQAKHALRVQKVKRDDSPKPGVNANLAFALDVEIDHSYKEHGLGAMVPKDPTALLLQLFDAHNITELKKELRWRWPKAPETGKPMRFIGAINVGTWTDLFHQLTRQRFDDWCAGSPYGYDERIKTDADRWLYFFTARQNTFELTTPDCAIMYNYMGSHDYAERKSDEHTEKAREVFVAQQKAADYDKSVSPNPPKGSIQKLTFKVDVDCLPKANDQEDFRTTPEAECFTYKGDLKLFGTPASQQTARRPLHQRRRPFIQAMNPVLSFSDCEHDVTHQFYGVLSTEQFDRDHYGKLDSSCT